MLDKISQSQHFYAMKDLNQVNKQLLDQFATIEFELANKEDENKVMAQKLVDINLVLEKIFAI